MRELTLAERLQKHVLCFCGNPFPDTTVERGRNNSHAFQDVCTKGGSSQGQNLAIVVPNLLDFPHYAEGGRSSQPEGQIPPPKMVTPSPTSIPNINTHTHSQP